MLRNYFNPTFLLFAAFTFVMIFLACIGGVKGYSPIPYWDMWDGTLNFAIKISQGQWGSWWAQHNEHRIFLSRLLFWCDINLFGGLGVFLIFVNYFLIGLNALILCQILGIYGSQYQNQNKKYQLVLSFFIVAWIFQWMQNQNLIWGFQSQFILVQTLPLCAFFFLSRSISNISSGAPSFLAACVFGVLSIGTMANGLLVLPLMFFYAFLYRQSKLRCLTLLALALIGFAGYLIAYKSPSNHGSFFDTLVHHPFGLAQYALVYIGSPFYYLARGFLGSHFALFWGVVFIALYSIIVFRSLKLAGLNKVNPLKFALLFYIFFILISASVTAGGRLMFGVESALASRYTTPALMAWATLLILFSPRIYGAGKRAMKMVKAIFVFLCLVMLSRQLNAVESQMQMLFGRNVAALALSMDIPDSDRVASIYPSPKDALDISKEAQERGLGFFSTTPFMEASKLVGTSAVLNKAMPECAGSVDGVDLIKGSSKYVRINGWIFDTARNSVPKFIKFMTGDGLIVGYGFAGGYRADVANAVNGNALRSGFEGYIQSNRMGEVIEIEGDGLSCSPFSAKIPMKLYTVNDISPRSDLTGLSLGGVQKNNQWIGSDYDHSSFQDMVVLGSYIKGDIDKGEISILIKPGEKLFYRSGPTGGNQVLEIPEKDIKVVLPVSLNWAMLDLVGTKNNEAKGGGKEVLIKLSDNGDGWGEWSAIALRK